MNSFLINFIALTSVGLLLYAMISDYMNDVEFLGAPVWTIDLLFFPGGILRGLYLGLK